MVLAAGSWDQLGSISGYTLLFLILSGAATGASWLCYFRALQIGDINRVVPVDKSSTVLTILLALIFLGEGVSLPKAAAVLVIAAGIFLMIEKKDAKGETAEGSGTYSWFLYAAGSAFFASLTSILGKIGISGVESNLGTAIRTCVVLVMAWLMVAIQKKGGEVQNISRRELGFICLSGVATGASWLCYYRALQDGPASVVAPVDKLSVLVTVVFSYFIFLFCVWGEAEQKSGRRPCASDSGNRSYGAAVRKSLRIVAGGLTLHLEKKIQGIVKRLRPLSAK